MRPLFWSGKKRDSQKFLRLKLVTLVFYLVYELSAVAVYETCKNFVKIMLNKKNLPLKNWNYLPLKQWLKTVVYISSNES